MKSWRSRIASAATVVATAVIAVPLLAGPASAATIDQWGYHKIGGDRNKTECVVAGQELLAQGWTNYYCAWEDPYWILWALPGKDGKTG